MPLLSGLDVLERLRPQFEVIPTAPTPIKEANHTTRMWSEEFLQNVFLMKHAADTGWDYKSDQRFQSFERAAAEIVCDFPEDPPISFTRPGGESDVSNRGAVTSQVIDPVWQVVQHFLRKLTEKFAINNVALKMENLKEQYSSEDSTTLAGRGGSHLWRKLVEVYFNTSDMGKQKSIVRLDHVFILNLFKITSPTTLEPLSGNKPYTYLKRGQAWDDNDLTSFEHSNTVIVVEIKDCGRIIPHAFTSFAKKGLAIGSTTTRLSDEEAATRAQLQQAMRYLLHYKTGQLCLTDYINAIILHDSNDAELSQSNVGPPLSPTIEESGIESSSSTQRHIWWSIVPFQELRKAMAWLVWLACDEINAAHQLFDNQDTSSKSKTSAQAPIASNIYLVDEEYPQTSKRRVTFRDQAHSHEESLNNQLQAMQIGTNEGENVARAKASGRRAISRNNQEWMDKEEERRREAERVKTNNDQGRTARYDRRNATGS